MFALIFALLSLIACNPGKIDRPDDTGQSDDTAQSDDSATGSDSDAVDLCDGVTDPAFTSTQGCITGAISEDGLIESFLGVPYAEPPTGDNRFARPVALAASELGLTATSFGAPCMPAPLEAGDTGAAEEVDEDWSEDCLTLNIWRPANASGPLPVLFYIHDGQYINGSGARAELPPELARSAVLVTFNARLGPLGYLAHTSLSAEDSEGISGNYGLYDTLMALQWVHDNADAMGGDADHVLVFGSESGGATACALLVSPLASGLMSAVVMQSPTCSWISQDLRDEDTVNTSAEDQGTELSEALDCEGESGGHKADPSDESIVACLRAADLDEIRAALAPREAIFADGTAWAPNIDGVALPDAPRRLIDKGMFNEVPVILGVVADEGGRYASQVEVNLTKDTSVALKMSALLRSTGNTSSLETLVDAYLPELEEGAPERTDDERTAIFTQFYGDAVTSCPARTLLRALSASTETHAYVYAWPGSEGMEDPQTGDELPYLFGSADKLENSDDLAVAVAVQSGWVFTAQGWAAIDGLGSWPGFTDETWVWFRATPGTDSGPREDRCDLYDEIGWLQD